MNAQRELSEYEMFEATSNFLWAEYIRLGRLRRTPAVVAKLREIDARNQQLKREVAQWVERNAL